MSFAAGKFAFRVIIFITLVILIYSLLLGNGAARGDSVPSYTLTTLTGGEFLSSSLGGKFYILHFWAWWCGKCVKELDELAKMYEGIRGDVAIIAVHEGKGRNDLRRIQKILERGTVNFEIYLDDGGLADMLKVDRVPASFLVNKDGIIVERLDGPQKWTGARMREIVQIFLHQK